MTDYKSIIKESIVNTKMEDDSYYSYFKLSTDLNMKGIKNKIFNTNYLFNTLDHYFLIVPQFEEFYYLVDYDLDDKCFEADPESLENYLNGLNIHNNKMDIEDIYAVKSIR